MSSLWGDTTVGENALNQEGGLACWCSVQQQCPCLAWSVTLMALWGQGGDCDVICRAVLLKIGGQAKKVCAHGPPSSFWHVCGVCRPGQLLYCMRTASVGYVHTMELSHAFGVGS